MGQLTVREGIKTGYTTIKMLIPDIRKFVDPGLNVQKQKRAPGIEVSCSALRGSNQSAGPEIFGDFPPLNLIAMLLHNINIVPAINVRFLTALCK
jgi:hypothetical protein